MQEAYLYEARRTPIGKGTVDGALYEVKPVDLLAALLRSLRDGNEPVARAVEDLFLGCVTPVDDQGFNLAKAALLQAEWPFTTSGLVLNRYVTSGLEAVNLAGMKVQAGGGRLILAGGLESQSRVPAGSEGGPLIHDPSLINRSAYLPKGVAADLLATLEGFSRAELDAYAARSITRSRQQAEREGQPAHRIPIHDRNGLLLLEGDENLLQAPDAEALEALPPAFTAAGAAGFDAMAIRQYPALERIAHVHTLGSTAQRADGAALILVGSLEAGETLGLEPRARILSTGNAATHPTLMLGGAVPAARRALERAGLPASSVDLWYCLEAFAAVCLHFQKAFKLDDDRFNPTGGAIAVGQALGAAGTMLLIDLLDEMERREVKTGLAAVAGGGGMGAATLIQRLN